MLQERHPSICHHPCLLWPIPGIPEPPGQRGQPGEAELQEEQLAGLKVSCSTSEWGSRAARL